ncbi:GWT1-domain-containing protein [Mycotypha africana]|uniref:GWT1-domain-containing protein n=1 Tax=Mycotypha africana TaxID=64632 RepID=UPI002301B27C|nr:GWT1-domain-containing protein [Mycotypha africana]KAI8987854.1 GWT1-domain-containing protein [Mycotypha africana]
MEISEEEYKLAKEAHVANCTGGSILEINMLCGCFVSSHMLWISLLQSNKIKPNMFTVQFLIYALPILLCMTIASNYVSYITIGIATLAIIIKALSTSTPAEEAKEKKKSVTPVNQHKPYLTVYRGALMIMTCIAILAVDFQFFPRRFAKVETFGTSLMDIGVGSFVFSSGVVASKAYVNRHNSFYKSFLNSFRSALPILALGFARLFLTKSVNYQEHTSEYGLHWNFFFTLGFLPPFVTVLGFLRKFAPFSVLGVLIATLYQWALTFFRLQDWILNAARTDLLSANKEGICSFLGYLSIFLFGLQCGVILFQENISVSGLSKVLYVQKKGDLHQKLTHLTVYSLLMWLSFFSYVFLMPNDYVSRRMANLPYIFWVIAFNLTLLSCIIVVELKMNASTLKPPFLDAINMNGLFTFLLANVLTGAINLSIRTLYMDDFSALLINVCYLIVITLVPWVLWRRYNIRVKI